MGKFQLQKLWKRVSNNYARAYDLRSNYAVTNINRWCGDGSTSDWDRKLVCLSRSMGHRYLQNTIYYYKLVPLFSENWSLLPEPVTMNFCRG